MNAFCHIVPWYNSDEWQKVYEELSDPAANKENALNTILVWKARCPSIPSGIESTLSLLQVHVQDAKHTEEVEDDQLLRLAYSSAIMRFVNHMLDTETVKGSSLYKAAKNLGVPDWIVDLRHDTAHSNNLPQIALLREACAISLQWLQCNYWDKYKSDIHSYVSGEKDVPHRDINKIFVLINLCSSLSICAQANCKIKHLSEVPNMDMRDSIMNDIKDLFGDYVDISDLTTVSIASLINIIHLHGKNLLNIPDINTHVNEAILGEDSLFLSRDLLYFFSVNDFKHKNKLNNSFIQCFEVLLTFLHTNDLLLGLVMSLIKITQNHDNQHFKARLAALWVSEILLALKRSQDFSQKLKKMTAGSKQSKKKKDLKKLYHNWFPSNKGNNLMLNLQKPIPKQLLDINYIQPIIAAYNPYLIYFIKNLLHLIEPCIPTAIADRVYKLAELISAPEKFPTSISTIYTADDLITTTEDDDINITEVVLPGELNFNKPEQDNQVKTINSIWRVASRNLNWYTCPIGQVPWQQQKNDVPMETNHN